MSGIGPSLPPHLLEKRKRKQEDAAPDAPPTASGAKRSPSPEGAEKRRKIAGPAMPPAPLDERPPEPAATTVKNGDGDDDSSSDDDDDFGPALPSAANASNTAGNDYGPQPARSEPSDAEAKPKRDDWMTMPPEADGLASRMDPTKQRARGFNTSKGAKAPPAKGGDGSAWHETPEQKRKRLEDEMMGIARPEASGVVQKDSSSSKKARDEEAARSVREHAVCRSHLHIHWREYLRVVANVTVQEKHRGPSLIEQHKTRKPDEAEDDPSKRAFDREKDIGSGLLGRAERKDFMNKSAGFSSKFSGGSYL